jgi:hypothetical protein
LIRGQVDAYDGVAAGANGLEVQTGTAADVEADRVIDVGRPEQLAKQPRGSGIVTEIAKGRVVPVGVTVIPGIHHDSYPASETSALVYRGRGSVSVSSAIAGDARG